MTELSPVSSNVIDETTRNEMLAEQIVDVIKSGGFDAHIDSIAREVKGRQAILKLRMLSDLHVGDFIMISQQCRPRMLAGEIAELTEVLPDGKFKVRLRHTYSQKWRAGNVITLPQSLVSRRIEAGVR